MITSASGYECVNVTNPDLSGFITGDIMPVRDNRGDGSWRAKRYEDLLFLHEAFMERKAVCDETYYPVDGSAQPKGRDINTSNFNNAVYFYGGMILHSGTQSYNPEFIDSDKSCSFDFYDTNQTSISDALLLLGFGFIDDEKTISDRPLVADDVRHAFWRTKKLRRTLYRFHSLGSLYTCTYKYTYKGGSEDGSSYEQTFGWSGDLYYTVPSNSISFNSRNLRVSFSPKAVTLPRWRANASSGRVSQWLFLCACTHSYRDGSQEPKRYKLVSLETNDGSPPSNSNMALFIERLASSVGFPYAPSPYEAGDDGYILKVEEAAFITEHDFPAEIDSLNWSWSPSFTS